VSKDNYDELTPEEKVELAINCVARGVDIPRSLQEFLKQEELLDAIKYPGKNR
jgi:hypothetical protein